VTRIVQFLIAVPGTLIGLLSMTAIFGTWTERTAQARRVVPVVAEVTQSWYREWRAGKSTRCEHAFVFEYQVDGVDYVGTRVSNWAMSNRCAPTGQLIRATPRGARISVYHDPLDPRQSFAYADQATLFYYLIPAIGICIVLLWWGAMAFGTRRPPERPVRAGKWHQLRASSTGAVRALASGIAVVWWLGSIPFAAMHWQAAALGHRATWYDALAALVVGTLLISLSIAMWMRWRAFADPLLAVGAYPLATGETVAVSVRQAVRRPMRIHEMTVSITARYKRGKHDRTRAFNAERLELGVDARPGTTLEHEFSLQVPYVDDFEQYGAKRFHWHIEFTVDGPGLVDQAVQFPVVVNMSGNPAMTVD
jgi:hypothetical protein